MFVTSQEWQTAEKKTADPVRLTRKKSGLMHAFLFFKSSNSENHNLVAIAPHSYLGNGAFGKVKRGLDQTGKSYAIKILTQQAEKNEIEVLSRLGHLVGVAEEQLQSIKLDNFLQIKKDMHYYLIQDLHEGINLSEYLKFAVLNEDQKNKIAYLILSAIHPIHEHPRGKIIHGDIKANNFILSSDGSQIKLIDFGASHILQDNETNKKCLNPRSPMVYRAPELITKLVVSLKTDIYATGIMLRDELKMKPDVINSMLAEKSDLRPDVNVLIRNFEKFKDVSIPPASTINFSIIKFSQIKNSLRHTVLKFISDNELKKIISQKCSDIITKIIRDTDGNAKIIHLNDYEEANRYTEVDFSVYINETYGDKSLEELINLWEKECHAEMFRQQFSVFQQQYLNVLKNSAKLFENSSELKQFFELVTGHEQSLPVLTREFGNMIQWLFSFMNTSTIAPQMKAANEIYEKQSKALIEYENRTTLSLSH